MVAEKGSDFLLKVGNGAEPPVFATVAGMRTTQMSVNGEAVNVTHKDSGGWRELLSGAGVRSVSVAASGIFTGSAEEIRVKANALAALKAQLVIVDQPGERNYALSLESSGPVTAP